MIFQHMVCRTSIPLATSVHWKDYSIFNHCLNMHSILIISPFEGIKSLNSSASSGKLANAMSSI